MYIYLRQLGSHKWQNLIGLENLKIPGFHFHGTMKLFAKAVLAIFCESPSLSQDKLNEQRDCKTSP